MIGGQVVDTFSVDKEIDTSILEYIHRNKTGFPLSGGSQVRGNPGRLPAKRIWIVLLNMQNI
ncbi:MAG: hypothetical protein RQM92_06445 [Candidatus Syntrophopropionicum ammoniitolerans]